MDDLHRLEAKGLARAKIRSQRRRVSMIRRRTIRGSMALFALFWAIIFGQLVTGNDPALSRSKASHERLAANRAPRPGSAPAAGGATPSTAPPEPEPEAQLERELEREREFEPVPEEEFEQPPEVEPEAAAPEETLAPEPEPEPLPPIVTSAS